MKCSFLLLLSPLCLFSQGVEIENPLSLSNIQTYTPSKLLSNDQWDIKWFNNLYTETKEINHTKEVSPVTRRNFFTSTLDIFCGISPSKRLNVGFIITYRSATINGENLLAPFSFQSSMNRRLGISRLAPAIKFTPFKKWPKFAIQSSLSIPLFENETEKKSFWIKKGTYSKIAFFMTI